MARPDPERLAALRSSRRANAVVERRLEVALHRDHDLPLAWFDLLATVHEAGGKMRAHELAEQLMVHKSSLSRQLDRLEAQGYVRRDRAEDDGRGLVVGLTKQGRARWRHALPTYRKVAQQAFCTHLTDTDLAAVTRLSGKILLGE